MSFGFQNPKDGYPMVLVERDNGSFAVEPEEPEGFDPPTESTLRDAQDLTRIVRRANDVHHAVDLLIEEGADIV